MIAKSKVRYKRISPRKIREVIDLIRGKKVNLALAILTHTNKGAAEVVAKAVNSAITNAKTKGLDEDQLYISKITADQGPSWKRFRAVAFGRATGIIKKTTHLTVELNLITK